MAEKGLHKYTVQESQNVGLGQAGCILIDDFDEHDGPFVAITALEETELDTAVGDMSFITDVADFTLPSGVTIFGDFASIALDSGKVIAYYGRS